MHCIASPRHGGPDLKGTQSYPVAYGRKLADLAIQAGVGCHCTPLKYDTVEGDLVGPTDMDPWDDADMLSLHGFLRKCWAETPWC